MVSDSERNRMAVVVNNELSGYGDDDKRAILKQVDKLIQASAIARERIVYAGSNKAGCVDSNFHY